MHDLGGRYECMRCGKQLLERSGAFMNTEKSGSSRCNGRHDLQGIVETNGNMFVWCRRCSGNSRVKLGRRLVISCPHLWKRTKEEHVEEIPKIGRWTSAGGEELEN